MLQQMVELFAKNGESWTDTLLISQPDAAGNYTFTDRDDSTSDQQQLADDEGERWACSSMPPPTM